MPLISPATFPSAISSSVSYLRKRSRPQTKSEMQLHRGPCNLTAIFSIPLLIRHNFLFASLTADEQEAKTSVNLSTPNPLSGG